MQRDTPNNKQEDRVETCFKAVHFLAIVPLLSNLYNKKRHITSNLVLSRALYGARTYRLQVSQSESFLNSHGRY